MEMSRPPLPVLNGPAKVADPEEIPASGGLFGWLFAVPKVDHPRTLKDIFFWWERRRIPYNLFVCILFLISVCILPDQIVPHKAVKPLAVIDAILETLVAVNIAYSFGCIVQWAFWAGRKRRLKLAPILLKTGMIFSIVVVILPTLLMWLIPDF